MDDAGGDDSSIDPSLPVLYELEAVIYHRGQTAKSGHYLCDVWDHERCQWIRCNDETITSLTFENDHGSDSGDDEVEIGPSSKKPKKKTVKSKAPAKPQPQSPEGKKTKSKPSNSKRAPAKATSSQSSRSDVGKLASSASTKLRVTRSASAASRNSSRIRGKRRPSRSKNDVPPPEIGSSSAQANQVDPDDNPILQAPPPSTTAIEKGTAPSCPKTPQAPEIREESSIFGTETPLHSSEDQGQAGDTLGNMISSLPHWNGNAETTMNLMASSSSGAATTQSAMPGSQPVPVSGQARGVGRALRGGKGGTRLTRSGVRRSRRTTSGTAPKTASRTASQQPTTSSSSSSPCSVDPGPDDEDVPVPIPPLGSKRTRRAAKKPSGVKTTAAQTRSRAKKTPRVSTRASSVAPSKNEDSIG